MSVKLTGRTQVQALVMFVSKMFAHDKEEFSWLMQSV
jgi:hypothetical protein